MGDGENWTVQKTESMENSHLWILSAQRSLHINVHHINVLNVEMEPRMGDGENWTNGKFWKTEPMVTTHRCPCINVLNIGMEPRMGDGENWTNGKFRKLNQRKIHISRF